MSLKIKIGIIGGSGLDDPQIIQNATENTVNTPFGPPSDNLIAGAINGVDCVLLSRHGRKHSITPTNINYKANIWALKEAGCTHILATTACGSLQENISPGNLVIPDTFIDMTKKRDLTFYDGGHFPGKVLHMPMRPSFCEQTRNILINVCEEMNVPFHPSGTVVVVEGPRFSTYAESNFFRLLGAHLVNMTMVPEVILAKELGLCYASVAIATDYDCWHDTENVVSVPEVLKTLEKSTICVTKLLISAIEKIGKEDWRSTINKLQNTLKQSLQNN